MEKIITRLAPSPTGKFHLGTARTALFAWLFAKKNKGKFLLRIEDTDKERSQPAFVDDILTGLKWLGLDWDGEIIYQSKRLDIYRKYIDELIEKGLAYEKDGAVWFKMQNKKIIFSDLIRGKIEFDLNNDKDFVIVKSDGTPLFMLSNVIDDALSGVTHIIRGDDHISNTPRQILLYSALGFENKIPQFAHLPLILNSDRTKMSKRHDPVSVTEDFKDKGFLPPAMVNYLFLLGFHPAADKEILSLGEMTEEFNLARVQKSPAIFDMAKLEDINSHYLRQLANSEITKQGGVSEKVVEILKDRAKTMDDFKKHSRFIFELPQYQTAALIFKKSDKEKTQKALKLAGEKLEKISLENWTRVNIKKTLETIIGENNLANGDVFWPVRVALSGLEQSPPPEDIAWALEKEETVARINQALEKL